MPSVCYQWKEPCQRRIGVNVNKACAELTESAWWLVPHERAASCRTDVKLDVHWGVSVQGAETCNGDPNQNISGTQMQDSSPQKTDFSTCEYLHEEVRPHQTLTQRTEKQNQLTAIRYTAPLSFMWLPLFQAAKDTSEENEQSTIILQ